jgi:hypothetical protein
MPPQAGELSVRAQRGQLARAWSAAEAGIGSGLEALRSWLLALNSAAWSGMCPKAPAPLQPPNLLSQALSWVSSTAWYCSPLELHVMPLQLSSDLVVL